MNTQTLEYSFIYGDFCLFLAFYQFFIVKFTFRIPLIAHTKICFLFTHMLKFSCSGTILLSV